MENKSLQQFLKEFQDTLEKEYKGQFILIGSTPQDYFVHLSGTRKELERAIVDALKDNEHVPMLIYNAIEKL